MSKEEIVVSPLRLPASLDKKLKEYMSENGAVKNKVVIQAVKEFLEKRTDPDPAA